MIRRSFDIVGSIVGLLVAGPLMAVIALTILFETGRPILFRQIRVGRGAKPFTLIKFRSMVRDHSGGPLTSAGDPRVTRTGMLLRTTKLDELPQLWNILRGEMSIVGPRPELECFVAEFPDEFRFLLTVRPGLVDPASLAFCDEADFLARYSDPLAGYVGEVLPRKIRMSAEYLVNRTMRTDLALVWKAIARTGRELVS